MLRIENRGYSPEQLAQVRLTLKKISHNISNIRVSSRAIEFDFFADSEEELPRDELQTALGRILLFKPLTSSYSNSDDPIGEAMHLYKEERFWEAHEVLEGRWRIEKDVENRELLQSLILLCAALVHMQKGRDSVSLGILKRAEEKISKYLKDRNELFGIDFSDLKEGIKRVIDEGKPRIVNIKFNPGSDLLTDAKL
ncbi:MAG: DUF309 domain-containing protein [Conexivisphaerales archaeon]